MSDAVAADGDGSLALELAGYITQYGYDTAVTVTSGGDSVPVADGWYLVTAQGRRPLFAWVDGAPVSLSDKADTPTLDKEVEGADGTWGDAATGGAGQDLSYRITVTVPDSYTYHSEYRLTINDTWDEGLLFVEGSLGAELVRAQGGERVDITGALELQVQASSFTATFGDLRQTPAQPGDKVVLTYRMSFDPSVLPGSDGFVNRAWATYPSHDGEGQTPPDRTRSYTFKIYVHKLNAADEPLEGAVFAVRDSTGAWLKADGTFGSEQDRATFTSGVDGTVNNIPVLAPGDYTLIELEAPDGYITPPKPSAPFTIVAALDGEELDLTVEASGNASVAEVSAADASATLEVVNEPVTTPPPGGSLTQTWDAMGPLMQVATVMAALGVLALVAWAVLRRQQRSDEGRQPGP